MSSALIPGYGPFSETKTITQEEGKKHWGVQEEEGETLSHPWGQTEGKRKMGQLASSSFLLSLTNSIYKIACFLSLGTWKDLIRGKAIFLQGLLFLPKKVGRYKLPNKCSLAF